MMKMNRLTAEQIEKLNKIASCNKEERAELIQSFEANHPGHVSWLDVFKQPQDDSKNQIEMPVIEGFTMLRSIGTGANGQVYLALTQEGEQVAIKVPNVWLSNEQLNRFKHESDLLRRLNHPFIAKIHSVGEYIVRHQKMPYIVMEFIDGLNIKSHCQKFNLSQNDCIQLMTKVLEAIQHAHQNRVIHRDIKPDNIIVDQSGTPKIIDFGIATLAQESTQALTQITRTGEVVGTLSYMSPEQVSGAVDLDSRSDVYSSGVVFYELLVNALPHKINPAQLFSAISAIVEEPIKPITQHSVFIDEALAAVVHHALEKKTSKRFQSAHEFAKDLKRWLSNEPVESQALSKFYWIKQAAKKNKALVVGTALAFTGLLIGLVFAVSFATKEKAARALADNRAESNRKAVEFINDLFVNADPSKALGQAITVRQVVSSADYAVDKKLADSPLVESQIRLILGNVNHALERFDEAARHYDKGLALINETATLYPELMTEKIKLLGATSKFDQQLQLIDSVRLLMNEDQHSGLLSQITIEQAANFSVNNRTEEAESLLKNMQLKGQINPEHDIAAKKLLGTIYREQGRFSEAESLFRELVDNGVELYGTQHPITIDLRQELALSLRYLNRLEEAVVIYKRVVEDARTAFSDDSLTTLLARVNLVVVYMFQGDFEKAEIETADILPKMIEQVGTLHQYTMSTRNIRAGALDNLGRIDEAIVIYESALNDFAESENKDNPVALTVEHNMAIAYTKKDDYEKAANIYGLLIPKCFKQLSRDHRQCFIFADAMAEVEIELGGLEAAQRWLDYSTPGLIKVFGVDNPRVKASEKRQQKLNEMQANQK